MADKSDKSTSGIISEVDVGGTKYTIKDTTVSTQSGSGLKLVSSTTDSGIDLDISIDETLLFIFDGGGAAEADPESFQ